MSNQFSASFCVTTYLSDVFAASHTTLNLSMCTIIIGALQIVGNYVTTLLCDKYGRRILMLTSTSGASACLLAFGTFTFFAATTDLTMVGWLPLVILSLFVLFCNIGMVGCLFVVLVELFPAKVGSIYFPQKIFSIYIFADTICGRLYLCGYPEQHRLCHPENLPHLHGGLGHLDYHVVL